MKKQKVLIVIATLIIITTLVFALVACNDTGSQSEEPSPTPTPTPTPIPEEYTVTFESNGGSAVASVTTGKIEQEPSSTRSGFTFEGWYDNAVFEGSKLTFPLDVTMDMTLYAKWEPKPTINYTKTTLDDFEYTQEGGVVTLTKYLGTETHIALPDEAMAIGYSGAYGNSGCFYTDASVEAVFIPATITSIDSSAFYWASKLTSIEVEETSAHYAAKDGVLFSKDNKTLMVYPFAKSYADDVDTYSVPAGVEAIGEFAFGGCAYKNIAFPNTLTAVKAYAFISAQITKAILPESVTTVQDGAFYYCTQMKEFYAPKTAENCAKAYNVLVGCATLERVTAPGNLLSSAMGDCKALTTLVINGGTDYGGRLAMDCTNLVSVTLPEGLLEISTKSFENCTKLVSINIPSTVTSIGSYAFKGCTGLKSMIMPSALTKIWQYAFQDSGLESISLNEGLTSIESQAFDGTKITEIRIPSTVNSCPKWDGVTALETIYCPAKFANRLYANSGNESGTIKHLYITSGETVRAPKVKGLLSISLPASITDESLDLSDCRALCQVTNLSACEVTLPDDFMGEYRTSESTALQGVFAKDDRGMITFTYNNKVIACSYQGDKTSIVANDLGGYTDISAYAFNKSEITDVVIPSNIKSIGYCAFNKCTALENVVMQSGVEKLSDEAFFNCSAMKSVYIPASVTTIVGAPFMYCGTEEAPITIKCEAASAPSGWESTWKNTDRGDATIVWNAKE